jgi:hypothetical protein
MSTKPIEEMTDAELEAAEIAQTGAEVQTQENQADAQASAAAAAPAPAAAAAITTATSEAAKAAVAEPAGKVAGVASKDGARVLPYSALQAERRAARHHASRAEQAEAELARARQEIEALRKGESLPPAEGEVTEADIAQMEEDFPEIGKKMRAVFNQRNELARQVPQTTPKEEPGDDPLQEAIDEIPLLVEWQSNPAEHADKFARAQTLDAALKDSPKWKDKPIAERFAHVTRLVADEFDIPYSQPTRTAAQAGVQNEQLAAPNTLSDFKGGAVPNHGQIDTGRLQPAQLLGVFSAMTDEELDAHLAKHG